MLICFATFLLLLPGFPTRVYRERSSTLCRFGNGLLLVFQIYCYVFNAWSCNLSAAASLALQLKYIVKNLRRFPALATRRYRSCRQVVEHDSVILPDNRERIRDETRKYICGRFPRIFSASTERTNAGALYLSACGRRTTIIEYFCTCRCMFSQAALASLYRLSARSCRRGGSLDIVPTAASSLLGAR